MLMLDNMWKPYKRRIKNMWLGFVRASSLMLTNIFPYPERISRTKELLILRLDGIGDTVLFSGCLPLIRDRYKDHVLKMIVRHYVGELLKNCAYVDEIIPIDIQQFAYNPVYRISFIRRLRRHSIEVVIYPMWTPSEIADELCRILSVKEVYAFGSASDIGFKGRQWHRIDVPPSVVREIDRYNYFMRLLGTDTDASSIFPQVWISDAERRKVRSRFQEDAISSYIVLVPGAGSENRTWPLSSWVKLLQVLLERMDHDFVLVGGRKDLGICDQLYHALNSARIKNRCSFFTLTELASVLESATLCIGTETGPVHIAAAVGTPVVCIMGGGHFGRFFPYGNLQKNRMVYKKMECYDCNWNCIYESTRCITEIDVADVVSSVRSLVGFVQDQGVV